MVFLVLYLKNIWGIYIDTLSMSGNIELLTGCQCRWF